MIKDIQPLPAAVIGAGGRVGAYYLKGLENIGAPVVAFDTNEDRVNSAAQKHPRLTVARTIDEALDQAQIAYVITPDHVRRGVVDRVLTANNISTVIIEKPLATNPRDAEELFELAKANGKQVVVGSTYRATPQFEAIKQGVASGEIGKVIKAHGTYHHDLRPLEDEWRKTGEGQNFYFGAATHPVDTLMHIVGQPVTEVTAMESRRSELTGEEGFDRPELIDMTLRFADNTLAQVSVNLVTPLPPGEHGMDLIVSGTEGEYRAHNKKLPGKPDGEFLVFKTGQDAWETREVTPVYTINTLVHTADRWARGEVESPYPFATIDQAVRLTHVLAAAERSAKTGQTERVVYQN